MLYWAAIFFMISIIAGVLGMNQVAGVTMDIAQFFIGLFFVLAILFVAFWAWAAKKTKDVLRSGR